MTLHVVHLPYYDDNPYQDLLMAAQRELGMQAQPGGGGGNFLRSALWRWKADVLHFHWLHPYFLRPSALATWLRGTRFLLELLLLRLSGKRLVWTLHNLVSHDSPHPALEQRLTRIAAGIFHSVTCHSHYAASVAKDHLRLPAGRLLVLAQPEYTKRDDVAIPATSGRQVRFTFLFVGRLAAYKGLIDLVDAFSKVEAEHARLVIAGAPAADFDLEGLRSRCVADPRITLHIGHVSDNHMVALVAGTHVAVLPFRQILTSGSVIWIRGFGVPCILPELDSLRGAANDPGILWFRPGDIHSLAQVMGKAMAVELPRGRPPAPSLTWREYAQRLQEVYGG